MPSPVAFTVTSAPLPVNFSGTPQEFATALVDRLTVTPSVPWSAFITGGTIPTSDNGPLLYNAGAGNKEWRVWDTGTGAYTYLLTNGAGLLAGSIPLSKLTTDISTASTVLIRNASGVPTTLAGSVGQVLGMSASGPAFQSFYPARGQSSASQTVLIDGSLHKMVVDTEVFDPNGAYNPTLSRYTAPTEGYYAVYARCQVDNAGGSVSGMEIAMGTSINGNAVLADRLSGGTSVASPPGARWYLNIGGIVHLSAGDYLEIAVSANDGVNASNVTLSGCQFSCHRIQ
jgi:hypothetical protein